MTMDLIVKLSPLTMTFFVMYCWENSAPKYRDPYVRQLATRGRLPKKATIIFLIFIYFYFWHLKRENRGFSCGHFVPVINGWPAINFNQNNWPMDRDTGLLY